MRLSGYARATGWRTSRPALNHRRTSMRTSWDRHAILLCLGTAGDRSGWVGDASSKCERRIQLAAPSSRGAAISATRMAEMAGTRNDEFALARGPIVARRIRSKSAKDAERMPTRMAQSIAIGNSIISNYCTFTYIQFHQDLSRFGPTPSPRPHQLRVMRFSQCKSL